MNVLSMIAEAIRIGAEILLPGKRDLLEWELQEIKKFREELEGEKKLEASAPNLKQRVLSALREIQAAKAEIECPSAKNVLEEIEIFTEEKLKDLVELVGGRRLLEKTAEVLEEEKVEDWAKLDVKRKEEIKQKIKQRLGG